MARTRISTTVDRRLLDGARRMRAGLTDAALIDEALGVLLARNRAAEVDAGYAAYDGRPHARHLRGPRGRSGLPGLSETAQ